MFTRCVLVKAFVPTPSVYLKLAAVEGECVQYLSCDSKAIQTPGDPSSFQNSRPGLHAVDTSELLSTKTFTTARKRSGTGC